MQRRLSGVISQKRTFWPAWVPLRRLARYTAKLGGYWSFGIGGQLHVQFPDKEELRATRTGRGHVMRRIVTQVAYQSGQRHARYYFRENYKPCVVITLHGQITEKAS